MEEPLAGRLERTGARARALLGGSSGSGGNTESTEAASGPPGETDKARLAERISSNTSIDAEAARAFAGQIVEQARAAMDKLAGAETDAALTDADALALESVIHVRGRPALRVYERALQPLNQHPGSEFWQDLITDYEDGMMRAAAATGAVVVDVFGSGNPPWVEGSAWLVSPNRVVTNRHVLLSEEWKLVTQKSIGTGMKLAPNVTITINFAADDRSSTSNKNQREVANVLYVASPDDPVDIAVLEIQPVDDVPPLKFIGNGTAAPRNLIVIGHPGPIMNAPSAVQTVFGDLDSRKRVSFGKRLEAPSPQDIIHDASTVGGYSGAPVVGISNGAVLGLHYYGDPANGNLAVAAATIRAHDAHKYC